MFVRIKPVQIIYYHAVLYSVGGYPIFIILYYIILYCSGEADGYPKKLLLLYIHSYFIAPPLAGGQTTYLGCGRKNVGKGKEVCNNLFNERILFNGKTVVF